ncbi:MAG: hypothetical protein ACI9TP_002077 [Candidatus Azotimanducaceae bacterium]|jgi:hypothetical protein
MNKHPIKCINKRLLASLLLCLLGLDSGLAAEQPASSAPIANNLPSTTVTESSDLEPFDPKSGDTTKAQVTPLEQTVETFITSEEIDTDKAVDFPTNI